MFRKIKYEFLNAMGNFFAIFFGFIFPPCMCLLIYGITTIDIPEVNVNIANELFINFMLLLPLVTLMLGFGALISQEMEKSINTRLALFGYNEKQQLITKLLVQLGMLMIEVLVFCAVTLPFMPVQTPSVIVAILYSICMLMVGIIFAVIAYSLSLYFKKFSICYGIMMGIYFLMMILSGMMGIRPEQLPAFIKPLANLMPLTQMVMTFSRSWTGSIDNLAPLLQSFIFLGSISGLMLIIALRKENRGKV